MTRKQKRIRIILNVDGVLSNHYVEREVLSSPANYKGSANTCQPFPTCQFVSQINVISRQALVNGCMAIINPGVCFIKKVQGGGSPTTMHSTYFVFLISLLR